MNFCLGNERYNYKDSVKLIHCPNFTMNMWMDLILIWGEFNSSISPYCKCTK